MKFVLAIAVVCSVLVMSSAVTQLGAGQKFSCVACRSPVWARPYCPCGNALDKWGCPTLCCRSCKVSAWCDPHTIKYCPLKCPVGYCHHITNGCPTCKCRLPY